MPPIVSETFARGLVNKIMIEAFDVLETSAQSETPMAHNQTEHATNPTEGSHTNVQMRTEKDRVLYSSELLRGSNDMNIGEPNPTLHGQITVLEQQVKQTICDINDALLCETIGTTGTYVVRGQGDVCETMPQTAVDAEPIPEESVTPVKDKEPGAAAASEHLSRQIQELESIPNEPTTIDKKELCDNEKGSEQKEQLVDSTRPNEEIAEKEPPEATPVEVECASHSYDLEEPKLSTTMLPSTSFARHASLEEVPITETMSDPPGSPGRSTTLNTLGLLSTDEIRETPSLGEIKRKSKKLKKIGFFSRLRRLFRSAFGRRKD